MGLPLHSRLRKKLKNLLNSLLFFLFPTRSSHDPIPASGIRRILIIRINYRIGNILFTTPLLRALERRFPDATIDYLVGAAYTVPLLKGSGNVDQVYDFPRKLLKHPLELYRYIRRLRSERYDLVINLNTGSASDRAATFLARSTFKLGFDAPGNWSPSTHAVIPPPGAVHEALKPLHLMKAFGNDPSEFPQKMDIALSSAEREAGRAELRKRLEAQGYVWNGSARRIALFRDARFEKKIDSEWWREWYSEMKRLNPDAVFIDILSPDVKDRLAEGVYLLSEKNLRFLGGILSQMSLFVCGDTGPMHLASASGVPTVALFKATAPALYGTLGESDLSLNIASMPPQAVAAEVSGHLASLQG